MADFVELRSGQIRIDARGELWYGEQRIEHPRVLHMLRVGLRSLPTGGYGYLMGPHSVRVIVDDAPFLVVALWSTERGAKVRLACGRELEVDPEALSYRGDIPYLCLPAGDRARFAPSPALALGHLLEGDGDGVVVVLGGRRVAVPGARLED
jgi:hypothetical protein